MASVKQFVQHGDMEAEGLPTWHDAMRELASVHLRSRLSFPKLLNDEGFAKGIGVADVCRQPRIGVVQLLLPQVIAMRVVKGLIDLATGVVSVPACEPLCSMRGVLEEARCTAETDSRPNKGPELTWALRDSMDPIESIALGSYLAGLHILLLSSLTASIRGIKMKKWLALPAAYQVQCRCQFTHPIQLSDQMWVVMRSIEGTTWLARKSCPS